MPDYGADFTDQTILDLDKRIKKVYKEAAKDIDKKMQDFNAKYQVKEQKYLQKVHNGEMTQKEFDRWKAGQVFQGKQWQAKKEEIANVLHNSNIAAAKMINNESFSVFGTNANYGSYQIESGTGVNFGFSLYDQDTVTKLIKEEPNLLPQYIPKKSKDMTWNYKKITGQITQGVIQGESLDKIAKRLATATASTNMNSMKTHARTLMTGAQNSGRITSYKNAQKLGIDLMKQWMATLDSHTRDSHADIDGEQVKVDEPFSNKLMYPGDPGGDPSEVYNCRCTLVSEVKKYPSVYNRYDNITGQRIKNMPYKDWVKAKKNNENMQPFNLRSLALKNLFGNLSQNGAYEKIKAIDTTLANKFYKELQTVGKNAGGIKPSAVWKAYQNDELPEGVSVANLEKLMQQYKDKALTIPSNSIQTTIKAPKTKPAAKSIPKAKDVQKMSFKTTDEWINAAKKNPSTKKMLEMEDKIFIKMNSDERHALTTYTGSAYESMNGYLRNIAAGMNERDALASAGIRDPWLKEQIDLCQEALSKTKLDKALTLRRGTDVGDLAGLFMKGDFDENYRALRNKSADELNKMFQGEAGKYAGFTSTSSQWDKGFSGNVECIIHAPKGTQAASIMNISQYGTTEGETLLNAGTKVICEKIEKSDGHKGSSIRVFLRIIE